MKTDPILARTTLDIEMIKGKDLFEFVCNFAYWPIDLAQARRAREWIGLPV